MQFSTYKPGLRIVSYRYSNWYVNFPFLNIFISHINYTGNFLEVRLLYHRRWVTAVPAADIDEVGV